MAEPPGITLFFHAWASAEGSSGRWRSKCVSYSEMRPREPFLTSLERVTKSASQRRSWVVLVWVFMVGNAWLKRTLEDGELLVVLLRDGDELIGFLGGGGEGLFADDCHSLVWYQLLNLETLTVLAGLKCQLGEGEVGIWGSGDDHDINCGVLDHLFGGAEGLHARVVLLGIIVCLGGALDNGVELELGDLVHEGNVEDLCAEAVADNADVVGFGSHYECES